MRVVAFVTVQDANGWECPLELPGIPRVGDHIRIQPIKVALPNGSVISSVYGSIAEVTWYSDHVWLAVELIEADIADGSDDIAAADLARLLAVAA